MAKVIEWSRCRMIFLDVDVGVQGRVEFEFSNQIFRHLPATKENITKQSPDQFSRTSLPVESMVIFAKEGLAVYKREGDFSDVSVEAEEGVQGG